MVETVTFEKTAYQKPPLKFEVGTPISRGDRPGCGARLSQPPEGLAAISAKEHQLLQEATKKPLRDSLELHIFIHRQIKAAIISFVIEGVHPSRSRHVARS